MYEKEEDIYKKKEYERYNNMYEKEEQEEQQEQEQKQEKEKEDMYLEEEEEDMYEKVADIYEKRGRRKKRIKMEVAEKKRRRGTKLVG